MTPLPFALRRPWLLARYALLRRNRPDLGRLRAIEDPERFLWAILPHAARTFSACIVLLPASTARAAAVGYLYCRILDTYEDLEPDPVRRERSLRAFVARFDSAPLTLEPPAFSAAPRGLRDLGYRLLVERCGMVDRVYTDLPPEAKAAIRDLVRAMGEGMCWSSKVFDDQGGVLVSEAQLSRYSRNVIGNPVVFALRLMSRDGLSPAQEEDAMMVGEFVQLANVTRDIEEDLSRGIAYHPALRPCLEGRVEDDAEIAERVRRVRTDLLRRALRLVPAYRRTFEFLDRRRVSLARASAVLMLLFTDRHYRACARSVHRPSPRGPTGKLSVFLEALPAAISRRWTRHVFARVERDSKALDLGGDRT